MPRSSETLLLPPVRVREGRPSVLRPAELLLGLGLLVACAGSHEPFAVVPDAGAPIAPSCVDAGAPGALAGGYVLVPFECRASRSGGLDGWFFSIGADGGVFAGVPDGPEAHGSLTCDAGTWTFRSTEGEPVAVALVPSSDPRVAFALVGLGDDDASAYWALPQRDSDPGPTLPEADVACSVSERWELRDVDGRTLETGERTPSGAEVAVWRLRPWMSLDTVSLEHPSLGRSVLARATTWDGRRGRAVASGSAAPVCTLGDEEISFVRRDAGWSVEVQWRVADEDDLDGDGDREEGLLRTTSYDLHPDGCGRATTSLSAEG